MRLNLASHSAFDRGRDGEMDDEDIEDRIVGWSLRVAVAVIFAVTGVEKFSSSPTSYWLGLFAEIGLGQWFRFFTGIVEILGGLLFLIPALTTIAAAILIATMLGAVLVHAVVFHHPGNGIVPAAYLIGVLVVTVKVRRHQRPKLTRAAE